MAAPWLWIYPTTAGAKRKLADLLPLRFSSSLLQHVTQRRLTSVAAAAFSPGNTGCAWHKLYSGCVTALAAQRVLNRTTDGGAFVLAAAALNAARSAPATLPRFAYV
jgi:hypothetical protein